MSDKPNESNSAPRKKHALFEPVVLVMLSLATVGTAWCSYQAATWSSAAQRTMNQSAAASRHALSSELQANQLATLDVLLFTRYVESLVISNQTLVDFYSRRFRPEAKTAFDAWMATRPLQNPNAPPHPFVTNFYKPRLQAEAFEKEDESQRLWLQAAEIGRTSRSYVLVTVLLASALFCGGSAPRFESLRIHRTVLVLGLLLLMFAITRLALLPVRF